ncbi:dihydrolipoyllysine-residue succinyltransferase component of oxoglutarate dehydrogenase [Besnoitia besnoiti]|uniref:dihydrolipoyllysine-residue succinyltransferase n=1 Tax=Besnoitia besnoiti TaxID=94643 RepID=A0A2A9MHU9_BESBE|nr:dihydrolipoyllysine-residue succinyltransferase component of oxoglutarate dehydrogenase [Besnoitia besnoiti]PFH37555.1 dihydrolipoyllysine-residue succinyltransferase component of oxoglutarate dehydrogenase [Besnoitia besnoiti]
MAAASASRRGLSSLLAPESRPRLSRFFLPAQQTRARAVLRTVSAKAPLSLSSLPISAPRAADVAFRGPLTFAAREPWRPAGARAFSSQAVEKMISVPSMGDSITEGTLNTWKRQPGDYVREGDLVAVIDTDKVSVDINAPESGRLLKFEVQEGDTVEVGKPLYVIDPTAVADTPAEPAAEPAKPVEEKAAPALSAVPPPALAKVPTPPPPSEAKPMPAKPAPPKSAPAKDAKKAPNAGGLDERRVPMSRMRLRIAERLKGAQNTAAMLTTFNECDMGNLMAMRSEMNAAFQERHGVKMGFVSAFMLASAMAMKKVPEVNAFIEGTDIVYKGHIDISVAVATPTGLMVPVVRKCEKKSWADLEKELAALAVKARNNQIALEDMAGGTFTISNGGVYGSMMGTPILNPPQASILGMHGITKRAVVKNDQVVIRPMMYLALTYDHRLIDGREAVTFLRHVRDYIEDPRLMLLDL